MKLKERIYADYFAPSRFEEYRSLLEQALEAGFKHYTVYELHSALSQRSPEINDKVFVHRHDVDTDTGGARLFFKAQKQLGIKATYYFRLSTLDVPLMSEIHEYGSEVGYHYEEIATASKRLGLRSKEDVLQHMDEIREEFAKNFLALEKRLGFKIKTVCSHGDFVNRALKALNTIILEDRQLRKRLSIDCEAYDENLMSFFDTYLSDAPPREYYLRGSPFEALNANQRIYLTTHPRNWRHNIVINTLDNAKRVMEEYRWRAR
jgi:hypothetical protein